MIRKTQKKQPVQIVSQQSTELKKEQKFEDKVTESVIQKLNFDLEENSNKVATLHFSQNEQHKKIIIQRVVASDSNRIANHLKVAPKIAKMRNKPITLGLMNSIKQGSDNKLYNLLDFSTYKQVLNDLQLHNMTPKVLKCNCAKTSCLKMYCECFANGSVCQEKCSCKGCHNCDQFQSERDYAISQLKTKNPTVFEQKIEDAPTAQMSCNCKRSKCTKNYCECFQNKSKCGSQCKCMECENIELIVQPIMPQSPESFRYQQQLDEVSQSKYKAFNVLQGKLGCKDSMNYSQSSFGFSRLIRQTQSGGMMEFNLKNNDSQGFNS